MRGTTYMTAGLYRLRTTGTGTAIFWCEPDESGDVAVFEREEQYRAGHKPMIRVSPQWFTDILIERIETERAS
ncbi:hypothetical protein [Bosea sp. (in: a-proteobacteria)]|uniref:hypothetical protein n=1 Tax=Bosea sp. (in: a-proteobacteria) TaxID=1871050 RepID=UPI0025BEE345|nr:hypothetical protein [Bosea sp. (in: a-proteobacteria)]MBR3190449.1 hypothetical protein [Bosea sp. (in: a-proteobacteria)]